MEYLIYYTLIYIYICILCYNLVSRDIQTTTRTNLKIIERLSGLSVWATSQEKLKDAIIENETVVVDDNDRWKILLPNKLLSHGQELYYPEENTELISDQINSLCIN